MRATVFLASVLIATALTRHAATASQERETMTIDAMTHRIMQSEAALTARMMAFRPIVEVYAQHQAVRQSGRQAVRPFTDDYFLGSFEWSDADGPQMTRLTPDGGRRPLTDWLTQHFGVQLKFEGFAAMTVPDWRLLDGRHHTFSYLRRESLGEARCLVFEVEPSDPGNGFTGRIWVEDRDFNIVRFNGITRSPAPGRPRWFSVDSWRSNVKPGMWLPSYVYAELEGGDSTVIKSHVRLWGYGMKPYRSEPEPPAKDLLERLWQAGVLAPAGDVDTILSTVISNLQLANDWTTMGAVTTRVMLTGPLNSFSVGRTIVLSRGLIDVLPDEASLAAVLAHELAHIALGHATINPQLAADQLAVPDEQLLAAVVPQYTSAEEDAANARMVEVLKHSPYSDRLTEAGLFLRAVSENAKTLKMLIQSHVAGYADSESRLHRLARAGEASMALPLRSRVVMDPWTSSVELARIVDAPAPQREEMALAVTPLVPHVRYALQSHAGVIQ